MRFIYLIVDLESTNEVKPYGRLGFLVHAM